jgi:hypothetical protein
MNVDKVELLVNIAFEISEDTKVSKILRYALEEFEAEHEKDAKALQS